MGGVGLGLAALAMVGAVALFRTYFSDAHQGGQLVYRQGEIEDDGHGEVNVQRPIGFHVDYDDDDDDDDLDDDDLDEEDRI